MIMRLRRRRRYPGDEITVAAVSSLMRERRNVGRNEDNNFTVLDTQPASRM
jgi:hypothetical protein